MNKNKNGCYIVRRLARMRPSDSRFDEQLNKLRHEDSKVPRDLIIRSAILGIQ